MNKKDKLSKFKHRKNRERLKNKIRESRAKAGKKTETTKPKPVKKIAEKPAKKPVVKKKPAVKPAPIVSDSAPWPFPLSGKRP